MLETVCGIAKSHSSDRRSSLESQHEENVHKARALDEVKEALREAASALTRLHYSSQCRRREQH